MTASFENASQLVAGNQVSVAGAPVGSISDVSLSDDGQAEELTQGGSVDCDPGQTPIGP